MNKILKQVKDAVRHPYAGPGGYPVYTVMADGELMCAECVKSNYRQIVYSTLANDRHGWGALGADVYWEGDDAICCNCNKALPSAYGNPESDDEEVQ